MSPLAYFRPALQGDGPLRNQTFSWGEGAVMATETACSCKVLSEAVPNRL